MIKSVDIYGRNECPHCQQVKEALTTMGIGYREHLLDQDVTREHVKKLFPTVTSLPIMVAGGDVYLGLTECNEAITTFQGSLGKTLLNE